MQELEVLEILGKYHKAMGVVAGRWQSYYKEDLISQFQLLLIRNIQRGTDPRGFPNSYWYTAFRNEAINYLRSERYPKVNIEINLENDEGSGLQLEAFVDQIEDIYLRELIDQVKQMVSSDAGRLLEELINPSGLVQKLALEALKARQEAGGRRAKTVRVNKPHLAEALEISLSELGQAWDELRNATAEMGLAVA